MPEFVGPLGAAVLLVGLVWLLIKPGYAPAGVASLGIGLAGWSVLLGLMTFGIIGGLILLFGNPFHQRRTSISTTPEGERTGSSGPFHT